MRRNIILTIAVFALAATSAVAQVRRFSYPGSLNASAVTMLADKPVSRSADNTVNAIVELGADADIDAIARRADLRLNVVAGNMATVCIPLHRLGELAAVPGIRTVGAGSTARSMCDISLSLTGADKVHAGQTPAGTAYDGAGVIVGIIDSGFDFLHSAFRNADGSCRIATVWDQNRFFSTAGTVPDYGYGYVFDNPADIEKAAHDQSSDTHGTHVAAIAASSADIYGGMAPGAEIALVSTNRSEAGIIDGLDFLMKYALAAGKPLAVNISLGTVIGFKDGSDRLASMLDNMLGDSEGRLVAIAAGNEGHRRSTIVRSLQSPDDAIGTRLMLPSYNRENLFVGAGAGNFTLTLSLHSADGSTLFTVDFASSATESVRYESLSGSDDGSYISASASAAEDGGAHSVTANLYYPMTEGLYWQADIKGEPARYIVTADYGELSEGSDATTIACSACGRNTVSVGAYVSRPEYTNIDGTTCTNPWTAGDEYPLSGKGPTFDGRNAPSVLAPGASVISAISSYTAPYAYSRDDLVLSRQSAAVPGHTDHWGVMNGTSMATPAVTGIMALWLQADPTLTPARVQAIIAGMGKIDALAGLKAISAGIDNIENTLGPTRGDIYDLGGRLVLADADAADPRLDKGIYILRTGAGAHKIAVR